MPCWAQMALVLLNGTQIATRGRLSNKYRISIENADFIRKDQEYTKFFQHGALCHLPKMEDTAQR